MSSPDRTGPARRAVALACAGAAGLLLAGCLRPLYGGVDGQNLKATMAAIEIDPIPDRIGHYLRSELAFDLDGSGQPVPKRYRLTITVKERLASPVVDTAAGRAQGGAINAEASFVLRAVDGDKVILEGVANALATYDRTQQRFASLRAARDAEIRLATQLSEQIRNRIAAALAAGG